MHRNDTLHVASPGAATPGLPVTWSSPEKMHSGMLPLPWLNMAEVMVLISCSGSLRISTGGLCRMMCLAAPLKKTSCLPEPFQVQTEFVQPVSPMLTCTHSLSV